LIRRTAGERLISNLLKTINHEALCIRAETLRGGIKCVVQLPSADQAYFNHEVVGGCNYHASIVFEDGKTWLARFRLPNHNEPPLKERNFDRRSEFATYCFLAKATVPVSEVYECADDDDPSNPVGAGYILLEKLAGKPMEWYKASETHKVNFSRQLADIYSKLGSHSLSMLGRLQLSSAGIPEAGAAFFDYDSNRTIIRFGPYSTSNEYYTALIKQKIQLIKTGEVADLAPLDQYLVLMSLLDSLPPNDFGPFFLRHVDSRDANFLVDNDYNITGIIDWELATLTSKSSAFQSPLVMYDLGELYDQEISTPSQDEKRFSQILREKGEIVLAGFAEVKLGFRVDQVIETDPEDKISFRSLFAGWWKIAYGTERFDWDEWYKEALKKYRDGGFGGSN
jgi:hypothetical protein